MKEIDLHVTNRCNMRCRHCNVSSPDYMPELTAAQILTFLKEARELGAVDLHVTGGEPLLRQDIFHILAEATGMGYRIEIVTNGIHLNGEKLDCLASANIEYLAFSLDGTNDVHDWLRREGDFNRISARIREAKQHGFKIRLNTAVFRRNMNEITNLMDHACRLQVDKHVLFYFTPIGRGRTMLDQWLNPHEWREFSNVVRAYAKTNPNRRTRIILQKGYSYGLEDIAHSSGYCRMRAREASFLMCDGRLFPCLFFTDGCQPLGNVLERPLQSLWNDDAAWEHFEKPLDEQCKKCVHCESCEGGCPGYAHLLRAGWKDPRCLPDAEIIPCCPWETIQL